jgi:hypothetical protein
VFARRSTHRLFMLLACGLILADRGTVTGMAAAAGIGRQWRRPAADMHAALRDALAQARINAISASTSTSRKTTSRMMTSEARAA